MKTGAKPIVPGHHRQRFADAPADPYALAGKLPGNISCRRCGAVYREGRWQWRPVIAGAESVLCTACRRIEDGIPAGYLYIDDVPPGDKLDEMIRLIRHHETRARLEHPMQRVMAIERAPARIVVTTTDMHLARELAAAVKSAFGGSVRFAYSKDEHLLRAYLRT